MDWIEAFNRDVLPCVSVGAKERPYNKEWVEAISLENLSTILEAIARSAFFRKESRGAHYRKDCKETTDDYLLNTVLKSVGDQMSLTTEPIVATRWKKGDARL